MVFKVSTADILFVLKKMVEYFALKVIPKDFLLVSIFFDKDCKCF